MISIVTDSSACVKATDADALGVRIAPMSYTAGDRVYSEFYSDTNGDFESLLRDQAPLSTAHPNPSAFLKCFEKELAAGNDVLCLTISARLSGAYSAANMAARQSASDRIAVLDSRLIAGGLWLLIQQARQWINGGMPMPELLEQLTERRNRIRMAFTVDDIAPLRKSGRMDFVRMSLSTVLNIKPILLLRDGVIVSGGTARSSADIITQLTRSVLTGECPSGEKKIVINYLGATRLASNLYTVLNQRYPDAAMSIHKIGPVLRIHLGAQVAAVSCDDLS
ncbi:MAG: DegV family protein [Clostridiales bacterium]|jgi:DegV family protein with EDD domain|nr:DegV family protein [Clostridiales bacterium]